MPFEANDFQEPYLRVVFGFIGTEDVEIVRAEGLALGPEQRDAGFGIRALRRCELRDATRCVKGCGERP